MILKVVDDDRRKDISGCDPWGDGEGASFLDYSIWVNGEKLWMASDMVYPKPERNHDYRGLSKIIYELLLDKMSLSSMTFCGAPKPNITFA